MRLQGTDGIRRPTALPSNPIVAGLGPLEAFLKAEVITPKFMQLYSFSFVKDLTERARFAAGDPIVVGWDPRDAEGNFVSAFIDGLVKAGATVLSLGIVPTPAVPLYMQFCGAKAGAMITASHNLKDQNGVKLFVGEHGMKYLPADDERLTRIVFELSKSSEVGQLPVVGKVIDHHHAALRLFERFMLDEQNSWVGLNGSARLLRFDRIVLVVDTANGCLSNIAGKLFRKWGFGRVVEVNTSLNGDVNENGGVAALEGTSTVARSDVFPQPGQAATPLAEHKALIEMFRLASELHDQLESGEETLAGAVFDADGDRFFRLDYLPHQDIVKVSSGDETAFLQARFLSQKAGGRPNRRLVHTVESDINVAVSAQEQLGAKPVLTAVGDKWILYEALVSLLEAKIELVETLGLERAHQECQVNIQSAKKDLRRLASARGRSSEAYLRLAEKIGRLLQECLDNETRKALAERITHTEEIPFLIGFEETGHTITFGRVTTEQGETVTVFAGNGLKSAINSFVASQSLLPFGDAGRFYDSLVSPFPPGFKRTYYAYYTNKDEFKFGRRTWQTFAEWLIQRCQASLGDRLTVRARTFPEDKDMLFVSLQDLHTNRTIGSVFVRNSGTEQKTGVNVRGPLSLKETLDQIGEAARRRLLASLKAKDSVYAKAESWLLQAILEGQKCKERITAAKARRIVADRFSNVVPERLLLEMQKQELVNLSGASGPAPYFDLTELGRWYLAQIETLD